MTNCKTCEGTGVVDGGIDGQECPTCGGETLPEFTELSEPSEFWVVSGFATTGRHTAREMGPFTTLDAARDGAIIVRNSYLDEPAVGVWILNITADGGETVIS